MEIILAIVSGLIGAILLGLAVHDTFMEAWQVLLS